MIRIRLLCILGLIILLYSCKTSRTVQNNAAPKYTSMDRQTYIEQYSNLAIAEMKRSGVPASITLAQALLESDNGNSRLARKANNHFGIKCHDWTGPRIYHDDDRRGECFRKYKDVYESYKDHSDFLVNTSRYDFLFELKPDDYVRWAKGLKKAGYATSRTYADLLIKIIEDNQLYRFDSKRYTADNTQAEPSFAGNVNDYRIHIGSKRTIHSRNRIDYVIVREGDTFESLNQELELLPWELTKYNELTEESELIPGQVLYLQPKRNKAERGKDFHIVKEAESMYDIAQEYGIKLNKLYERNNMSMDQEPETGEKILLRGKKKVEIPVEVEGNDTTNTIIEFEL